MSEYLQQRDERLSQSLSVCDVVIVYPLAPHVIHLLAADRRLSYESDTRVELFTKNELIPAHLVEILDRDFLSSEGELREVMEKAVRRSVMLRLRTRRPEISRNSRVLTLMINSPVSSFFNSRPWQRLTKDLSSHHDLVALVQATYRLLDEDEGRYG